MKRVCRCQVWIVGAGLLIAALAAAGCGGNVSQEDAATPPVGEDAAVEASEVAPTVTLPPSPQPTFTPVGEVTLRPEATLSPGMPDVPYELTGYEIIAANVGDATYSGYRCLLTEVGCACELPLIQQASFTFTPEAKLLFRFQGDGYAATWEMDRLGPNQWEYTIPIYDNAGEVQGAAFALLAFTEDGYIYSQGADLEEGGIVTCPDVTFRRLMSPTQTP